MGDKNGEARLTELFGRFSCEMLALFRKTSSDQEQLANRVKELEVELAQVKAELVRRRAQSAFATEMVKSFDLAAWENLDPSKYSLTIEDLLAEIENIPE